MAETRKRPDALNINMGSSRLSRIDRYWHLHQFRNRTAAIHALIDAALDAAGIPQAPDADAAKP